MDSIESLNEAIYQRAAKVIRSGRSHPPVVILQNANDADKLAFIDVSQAMSDDAGKDAVAALINMFSQREEVATVIFVSEAWMATASKDEPLGSIAPSQHPQRQECVVVSYSMTSKRALAVHPIRREPGKKPRLERGKLTVEQDGEMLDGRFFAERKQTH